MISSAKLNSVVGSSITEGVLSISSRMLPSMTLAVATSGRSV